MLEMSPIYCPVQWPCCNIAARHALITPYRAHLERLFDLSTYTYRHLPVKDRHTTCWSWSTENMLYLIGLGLCDATDITVKGLEIVRQASRVYLEAYTSILTVGKEELV